MLLALPLTAYGDEISSIRYFETNGRVEISTSGTATAQTPFAIASIGKAMTSVAVLRAVEEGALSLDDLVSQWIEEDTTKHLGGLDGITLRHLLTMTSGLPDYLTDDYIHDALVDPDKVQKQRVALSYAPSEEVLFLPGSGFNYSNTNYVLLGLILESVTGFSYAEALKHYVFAPAGMTHSFVFGSIPLPAGFPHGHEDGQHVRSYYEADGFGDGGVIATAVDVARFYKALFVDQTILTPRLMREFKRDVQGQGYGMGIEIEDGIYGHSGGDLGFSGDVRLKAETGEIAIFLIATADADTDWALNTLIDQ